MKSYASKPTQNNEKKNFSMPSSKRNHIWLYEIQFNVVHFTQNMILYWTNHNSKPLYDKKLFCSFLKINEKSISKKCSIWRKVIQLPWSPMAKVEIYELNANLIFIWHYLGLVALSWMKAPKLLICELLEVFPYE
jgi:hypothetical protein